MSQLQLRLRPDVADRSIRRRGRATARRPSAGAGGKVPFGCTDGRRREEQAEATAGDRGVPKT